MSALEGSDTDQDCISFPQGYCPAVPNIILFTVQHLFLLELVVLPMGPSDSPYFCIYLVDIGMVTNFGANPKVISVGKWDCLPYIRKYGLKPVVKFLVQLYVWTSAPILLFQSDFHSEESVPSITIRVELNLSHWLLVCGWYILVCSFCVPISLQRSVINSLLKFLSWSERIFLGRS